jgi:mannose-1-phosphate guanylyltransferase
MAVKKSGVTQGIKAVLLVGGLGTRLRPLTDNRPKSFLPVLNHPFLEHTIVYLKNHGITDIILTLNYLPDVIQNRFGDGREYGVHLTYCIEKDPLGTAGAVKNAEKYLDEAFFVFNGDVFTDMNLVDMLAFHRRAKAKATISLTWVDNPSAFGVVETDINHRVKRFIEKPPLNEATTNWINAGVYILEPEVLGYIPAGQHYMFEKGLFPRLLDIDQPVYGYTYKGYWLDMGTPQKYFNLNMDLILSKTKSPLLIKLSNNGVDNDIHSTAKIIGPTLIDRGCKIGPGVYLKSPVIIGKECIIREGAILEKAILWDNVSIGKNSQLNNCIIGSNTVIADNIKIKDSVVTPSSTVPLSVQ